MKHILISCLLLITMASCTKNSQNLVANNVKYHKAGATATTAIQVFVKTGEIKDAAILQRYTQHYASIFFDDIVRAGTNATSNIDTLVFVNDGTASFISGWGNAADYKVNNTSGKLILQATDIDNGISMEGVFTKRFSYYGRENKPPVLSEDLEPTTTSPGISGYKYKINDTYVLQQGSDLYMPVTIYYLHSPYTPAISDQMGSFYDNLASDFYTQLAVGDTIVTAKCQLLYKK